MIKITMDVDGMRCGACESHVNDSIRQACKVKKVSSSHMKNQTVVICEDNAEVAVFKSAVEKQGYKVTGVFVEPYENKWLFSFLKKK